MEYGKIIMSENILDKELECFADSNIECLSDLEIRQHLSELVTTLIPKAVDTFIKNVVIPIGWLIVGVFVVDLLFSVNRKEKGLKELLDICDEYNKIKLMFTLDQLVDMIMSSIGLDEDSLCEEELLAHKEYLRNMVKDLLRFYVQNETIPTNYIIQYGRYLFDDSRDTVNLLGIKRVLDKENFKRNKKLIKFPDRIEEIINKYKEEESRLPSQAKLMIFLCNKINFADLKRRLSNKGDMVNEVLKFPEFFAIKTGKQHKYFHYKFEDKEGIVEGDISLTKLQDMIALCV